MTCVCVYVCVCVCVCVRACVQNFVVNAAEVQLGAQLAGPDGAGSALGRRLEKVPTHTHTHAHTHTN